MNDYFERVADRFQTQFWINNATLAEAQDAIAAGATSATSNPTYLPRLLEEEPRYASSLIDDALRAEGEDDVAVVDRMLRMAVSRLSELFLPIHERTGGRHGFVAIQGNPLVNADADAIIESALRYRQINRNVIVKIPATAAGAVALEQLTREGVPTIATMGFSVDQAVYMAEAYRRARSPNGAKPRCFVIVITGIFEEHLVEVARREGVTCPSEWLRDAGVTVARAAYRIFQARGYEAGLFSGGARGPHHFSELVGLAAITNGWDMAQETMRARAPIELRANADTPQHIVDGLESAFSDFRVALHEESLPPEQFRTFGPVAAFQDSFATGFEKTISEVQARRSPRQVPAV